MMYTPDVHHAEITEGDTAAIDYADETVPGVVTKVRRATDGRLLRVGITPKDTDHVAWFAPSPNLYGLPSVGGHTVAYI